MNLKSKKITIIGDKFSCYLMSILIRNTMKHTKIMNQIEIFPIYNNNDFLYLENYKDKLIRPGKNLSQIHSIHKVIELKYNNIIGTNDENQQIIYSKNNIKSYSVVTNDSNKFKIYSSYNFINFLIRKKFEFFKLGDYKKLNLCSESNLSIDEFFKKIKASKNETKFFENYMYGK